MLREVGRGRKGNPDGRTMGPTGTWYQVEGGKVRKPDEGRKAQACTRNSFGTTGRGGKCRRAVAAGGRGIVQVDGFSVSGKEGG